jgi:FkbM family methyltransferase
MSESFRHRLAGFVNAALRPTGVELRRRPVWDVARRATYAGGFAHLQAAGLAPRTVIDVGVADGTPALYEAFPGARLVLIEPVEECRVHLEAIQRRYPRVEVVLAAAAREPGRLTMHVHRDIARSSAYWESDFTPDSVTRREVRAVTLDQLHAERAFEAPILLKLDVQGAELDVLAGAQHVLPLTEYIVIEASLFQFFPGAPLLDEVVRDLAARGFVAYDVLALQYRPSDHALTMIDVGFARADGPLRRLHRFHPLP